MSEEVDKMDSFLDSVAAFLSDKVPDYTELPPDSIHALEHIWIAIGKNRTEFIKILDILKRKNKKKKLA